MKKEYHNRQELTMAHLGLSLEELRGQSLELLAREGAKLVLAVALETEVTEFLQCQRYERHNSGRRGYRNGHRERQLSCSGGEIEIDVPRVVTFTVAKTKRC